MCFDISFLVIVWFPQELDQWLREHCIENVFTSAATLRSLAELLGKISNIVINDNVGAHVSWHIL
jgi:hypothetical protein